MFENIFNSINEKRLIKTFFGLVKIDSVSMEELRFIRYLVKELRKLKLSVKFQKVGKTGNLIAKRKGFGGREPVLFSAHIDTVLPGKEIKPKLKNGIIKSSGDTILGADDKSAIAVYIEAVRILNTIGIETVPVEFVFTYGEELGLKGAKTLDFSMIGSKFGFCFDSHGDVGVAIQSTPYHNTFTIEIKGKSAHAGIAPEKGINAIKIAAEIISHFKTGRIDKETTSNIGVIEGGSAANIIPERATIKGEIRSRNRDKLRKLTGELKELTGAVTKKYRGKFNIDVILEYKGYHLKNNTFVFKVLEKSLRNIGRKLKLISSNGGSDSNIFIAKGRKVLNLGIGMEMVHSKDEFIRVKNLVDGVKLVLSIILTLSEQYS